MQELLIALLNDFGLPLTFIAVLVYAIWYMTKMHKTERGEWREDMKEINNRYHEGRKETNNVLRELMLVINRNI